MLVRSFGTLMGVPFAARASHTLSHMPWPVDRNGHYFDQWTGGGLGIFADGRASQSPARQQPRSTVAECL